MSIKNKTHVKTEIYQNHLKLGISSYIYKIQ